MGEGCGGIHHFRLKVRDGIAVAGDGDGRYRNGRIVMVRLTHDQHERLNEVADGGGVSTTLRDIFEAFAALPKKEQKKLLDGKVSAA